MNDCVNAEIRDRFPDLLNGRLPETDVFAVSAHVSTCAECSAELELLRTMRGAMLAATPRIDYAAIVDRLPAPGRAVAPARRRWSGRWLAAAAAVVAVAGTSATLFLRSSTDLPVTPVVAMAPTAVSPAHDSMRPAARQVSTPVAAPAVQVASATHELRVHGDLSDLSESDLRALLDGVDAMDAIPAAEPDITDGGFPLTGDN